VRTTRGDRVRDTQSRSVGLRLLDAGAVGVGLLSTLALPVVLVRLAPAYLEHQPYTGALLMVAAGLLVVVAMDLWAPVRRRGMWLVGAAAALGAAAVYAVGAAFGLPDGRDESTWDGWVLAGLGLVVAYLLAMGVWFMAARARAARAPAASRRPGRTHLWKRSQLT
jgi:O-antigen/teichoic acid export membrane protein